MPVELMDTEKERLGLRGCDGVPAYVENPAPGLEGSLRMVPHRIKGEGHFAAALQKEGGLPEGFRRSAMSGNIKGVSEKELGEFPQFCRDNLRRAEPDGRSVTEMPGIAPGVSAPEKAGAVSVVSVSEMPGTAPGVSLPEMLGAVTGGKSGASRYIRFGENIYLVPQDMPGLKGLKVLRPGLHLGELKKNRFEPSHALALALSPKDVTHVWNLKADSPEAATYLNGQTCPAEGEKGWYLVCVDGFGIGWGKLAGGIMKNHYPRGLRLQGVRLF